MPYNFNEVHRPSSRFSGSSKKSRVASIVVAYVPPLRTRARAAATASLQARRTGATTLARHHAMTRAPICRCRRVAGCLASQPPAPAKGSAGRRDRPPSLAVVVSCHPTAAAAAQPREEPVSALALQQLSLSGKLTQATSTSISALRACMPTSRGRQH